MKVEKEEKSVVTDYGVNDLCAIPKGFAQKKLESLYVDNKQLLDEWNTWIQVLNSQVQVSNQDENKEVNPE